MVLKRAYKRTEVGEIPEDWDVIHLGECLLRSPDYGINAPAVRFNDNLPTYIRITDITDDGLYSHENIASVNHPDSYKYYLNEGDIVFARTGASVGKSYLYNSKDGALVFAGFLIRVSPNPTKLFPAYLSNYLQTGKYWNWVRLMSMRSGQPGINGNEYAKLPIPTPPTIEEQRAIAAALSDVDALLASLDALIAKKRLIQQGAMQELLTGKRRLPGFSGEWEVKRLGEIGYKFLNGGTPSTKNKDYWHGHIPWITGADIVNQRLQEPRRFITEEAVKNSSTNIIEKGQLLVVTRTGVGKTTVAPYDLAISQDLTGVYIDSRAYSPDFLFRYFDFNSEGVRKLNQGTSIEGITRETLQRLEIRLPAITEQRAIAAVLSDMDAEIHALEQQRDKTRLLKQGMMQELLTGRTRLNQD